MAKHYNRHGERLVMSRRATLKAGIIGGFLLYNDDTRAALLRAISGEEKDDQHAVPQAPPLNMDTLRLNDGWGINHEYESVVDRLNLSEDKKQFVKFAIAGVIDVLSTNRQDGLVYTINPRVMVAQAVLETGYGVDSSSAIGNYFGIQGSGNNTVPLDTHEVVNGVKIATVGNFRSYSPVNSFASFHDYARLISTKAYFSDAAACRYDDTKYLLGLENVINANGEVIGQQGGYYNGVSVKSYATDTHYVDSILNVIDYLNLNEVFGQAEVSPGNL